jgi:hypothetical protein
MRYPGQPQPQPPPYGPWSPQPTPIPRSRAGRVVIPIITLLLGIMLGVLGLLLYATSISTQGQVLVTPLPPPGGDIISQISPSYMARVVQKDLPNSGLPGDVENVRVQLADSDLIHSVQVTITGDDQIGVLGLEMIRHITVVEQLFVQNCKPQVNVLHADVEGIPVTGFVTAFEGQIDQQLQFKTDDLPPGFTYCITSLRSKPDGLFVVMSATPQ